MLVLLRALTAAACLVVLAGCGPAANPTPGESVSLDAPEVEIADLGAESVSVRPFADFVMSSGDLVWVSGADPGIVAFDASMQPVVSVEAGDVWAAMEFGHGAIWASEAQPGSNATTLLRIDASTGKTQRFPLPEPGIPQESSIGVTGDAVWVVIPSPELGKPWTVLGLDPASGAVIHTIDAGEFTVAAVRGGFGSVWVTRPNGVLERYDALSGELEAQIELTRSSTFLSIGPDAVWVMNQLGEVARVDPETNEVVATILASSRGIQGGDIVASDDAVWLQANARLGVEIDPATNEVVQRLLPAQGSGSVAITDDGAVWITAHDAFKLYRIPPE